MFTFRRKIFVLLCAAACLLAFFPRPALADNYNVSDGQFNLDTCAAGDTVTIAPGTTVELIGSAINTAVICGAGAKLPELLLVVAGGATVIAVLAAGLVLRSLKKSKGEPPG